LRDELAAVFLKKVAAALDGFVRLAFGAGQQFLERLEAAGRDGVLVAEERQDLAGPPP
jgi:hypothetical protein